MNQSERRQFLIRQLQGESIRFQRLEIPEDADGQRQLLRGLLNIRQPRGIDGEFLKVQDEYFLEETRRKGITDAADLRADDDGLCVWQGDITTLKCGAIVNAANSGMTGCYVPNHRCIDNCIHTFAGVQLRLECARMMQEQGRPEPVGQAKITGAYNLPCDFVIHTVGPIVQDRPTENDRRLLASCYRSCLETAWENGIESIAFCCISTGEFHFPNRKAAQIAVGTVREFLRERAGQAPAGESAVVKKVIFNVFKDVDRQIYEELLGSPCR